MKSITFVTANDVKFQSAAQLLRPFNIELTHASYDFEEIQADGEAIARHKAQQAFQELQQPLIISDDSWDIPGLSGFPGAFMKQVNDWFTPEDWLRLTAALEDRTIYRRRHVVFQDNTGQHYFVDEARGVLLSDIRGTSKYPHLTITSFDGGKYSHAELIMNDASTTVSLPNNAWSQLGEWFGQQ